MRVPVYPFDLTPKRRFKHIAKVLRRHWPTANEISLTTAQELLAQGLGYRDYHDVLRSSENWSQDVHVPTIAEVRDNVSTSIFHFLKSSNTGVIDDHNIERLVMKLPLHELLAFQNIGQVDTAHVGKIDCGSCATRSMKKSSKTDKDLIHNTSDSPGSDHSSAASLIPFQKYLSEHELDAIAELVRRRASLRDRVLCSVMLAGMRPGELPLIKVNNVKYNHQVVMLDIPAIKSHTSRRRCVLPSIHTLLVARYIKESGLSDGDYLFQSSRIPGHSITSAESKKILRSWLLDAKIDPAGVSIHTIRSSVHARLIRACADLTLSEEINAAVHYSPEMLRHYFSSRNKNPKE